MKPRTLLLLVAGLALLALLCGDASACPTCKDAVAANSTNPGSAQGAISGGDAATGFNNAIYVALGTVFSMIGFLGWRVVRAVRRADAMQS